MDITSKTICYSLNTRPARIQVAACVEQTCAMIIGNSMCPPDD